MRTQENFRVASGGRRRRQTAADRSHVLPSPTRSYTATQAKNEFGRVLDAALQGATVVITKHQAPRAVLISMDKFSALQQAPQLKLDTLSAEFDAVLSRMHNPRSRVTLYWGVILGNQPEGSPLSSPR